MGEHIYLLLTNLERIFAPLQSIDPADEMPLEKLLALHTECAEALAGDNMWNGPEAAMVKECLAEMKAGCGHMPVTPGDYGAVFETLLLGKVYRPAYGAHPRLKILSPLEARMQSFDRVILGGLNEGSWPADPAHDPWFNRPMLAALGLPAPERVTGLAAHDFSILLGAPEVFLTRAEKVQGQPAAPARWLVKLEVLLHKFGAQHVLADTRWKQWAAALDRPAAITPCAPPEPTPPLHARPATLSVTQVETWLRDPYALYASKILRLRKLDPLAQEPTAMDFGNILHKAMEEFVKDYPAQLPAQPYETLLEYGSAALQPLLWNSAVEALWWPRFKRIAAWVAGQETLRRDAIEAVGAEEQGSLQIGEFTLTGRADRIERNKDGSLTLIDYKTGAAPALRDMELGIGGQLVMLACIFTQDPETVSLEYWRLLGGKVAGEIKNPLAHADMATMMEATYEGLRQLIAQYNDADFPYRATPIPAYARRYNDYAHLARMKEWG